ncbi:hypothetical protein [Oligoflexus tunisiensis]|uniref:hypothetical protein n=1 Tax=Oligoflexus tunisiensis TaxID=708132 RepID=UPI00114CC2F6|nr:hypothetical protein [Oligoflexus tunisiensis]
MINVRISACVLVSALGFLHYACSDGHEAPGSQPDPSATVVPAPEATPPAPVEGTPDQPAPVDRAPDQPTPVVAEPIPPVETLPETPVSPTLQEAMKKLKEARAGTAAFASGRIADYGQAFWIGDGYDMLTGARSPSCLDPEGLETQVQPLYETRDSFQFVHSYVDLYKKMESEFGTEIGGAWQMFSASISVKTSMLQETQITSDDLVAVTSFSYLKDRISLYKAWPDYAPFFRQLQEKSPQLFRRQCGDRYTQDLTVGAGLYLVIKAKKLDSSSHNRWEVEAAIQAGIANIITIGRTFAHLTNEQKQILKSYSFSTRCYSMGTSADVCGAYSLNTQLDLLADSAQMQQKINEARQKIISEVKEGNNLVVMRETLKDYEVSLDSCNGSWENPCPDRWSMFYDYRPRADLAQTLLDRKHEVEEVCTYADFWPKRCARANKDLQTAILNCLSVNETCANPDFSIVNSVLTARNPGVVRVWEDSHRRGKFQEMSFNDYAVRGSNRPLQFFSIHSLGWQKLNDEITSIEALLQPGWTIRAYEHTDPRAAGNYWDLTGNHYVSNLQWFNDKVSAFMLIPPADLP